VKTIFLILIFLFLGLIFGFILAKIISGISNYFLSRKVEKRIKSHNQKPFFYKQEQYDLKREIEEEQSKRKRSFLSGLFKRKEKGGISDYGNTEQYGIIPATRGEQISRVREGLTSVPEPVNTPTPANSGEQVSFNPAQTGGFRTNVNGNLFKKGK
jgi:hypothetical protein